MHAFSGAPSPPVPILRFDGPGTVTLEWDAPFSWSQYPIKYYNVTAFNHPELDQEAIQDTSVQYRADEGHQLQECEEIEFRVRATNSLGDSEYGSVTAGFPIGENNSNRIRYLTLEVVNANRVH